MDTKSSSPLVNALETLAAPLVQPRGAKGVNASSKKKTGNSRRNRQSSKAPMTKGARKSPVVSHPMEFLGKVDAGVMQPSQFGVPLSFADLLNVIEATLGNYAMVTGIFVNDNNSGIPATNPSSFVLYCLGLVLTWVSKHGNLGGDNKNDICPDPRDLCVPLPIAKFMEYIAPCSEDGAKLITTFELDYAVTTTKTSYPDSGLYPDGLRTSSFPSYEWNSQYLKPDYNEYSGYEGTYTLTLADLWSNTARQISQEIKSAGLRTVAYGKIAKSAPNASAYTSWVNSAGISTTLSNTNTDSMMASNIFKNYCPEEALIFAGQATRSYPLNSLAKPVPRLATLRPYVINTGTVATNTTPWWMSAAYAFAFLGCRQDVYVPGPILGPAPRSFTVRGQPVTTLSISYQYIVSNAISQIFSNVTRQALDQTDKPWTTVDLETYRVLSYTVYYSLLMKRLNYSSPFWTYTNTNAAASLYNPQSYYVDADWGAESVPPVIQKFIDAVGYVLVDGGLVVPIVTTPPDIQRGGVAMTNAYTTPIGTIRLALFAGPEQYQGRLLSLNYGQLPATPVAPIIRVNGKPVDQAFANGYYQNTTTNNEPIRRSNNFWNGSKATITAQWRSILQQHCSGPSFNDSYIQSRERPQGRCSVMVTKVIPGRNNTTMEVFPTKTDGTTNYNYSFGCAEASVVGGIVALPRTCTVDAVYQCASYGPNPDSALNQGKYTYQLRSGSASSGMTSEMSQRTFAPNSAVAQALAAKRAEAADRKFIEVGNTRLPANAPAFDYATPALERVTNTMADALESAVLYTSPAFSVAGPLAPAMANLAAMATADLLRSWTGVVSGDPEHPGAKFLRKISTVPSNAVKRSPVGDAPGRSKLPLPAIAM